uniref:DUF2773 domain-containing protein n=1 Tax=Escherichia coli TaxID=562 RepID=UPI000F09F33A
GHRALSEHKTLSVSWSHYLKTAWLKEDPSLLLFVDQPDLSQLRDLVKTGATRKIRSEARHRLEEKQ